MATNYNSNCSLYYIRQSDGLAYCFSPVPFITESQERIKANLDDSEELFTIVNTTSFNGTLLPEMPSLSGVSSDATCIELLDRKSDQLRSALSEDRGNLLLVDSSGYTIMSVYPRVVSVDFDNSQMTVRRDYNIVFEYESNLTDGRRVRDYSENWSFNYQEDDTVAVSHNVSAVGISNVPAGTGALANAKYFVLQRANTLKRDRASFQTNPFVSSIIDVDSLTEFNHTRSENVNESAGSYDISESWILASGSFKDDRTVATDYQLDSEDNLVSTVTVNGTVVGYGDTTFERFTNAQAGFNNFVIPQIGFTSVSGVISKNVTDNRFAGTVNYSITFSPNTDLSPFEDQAITRSFQRNEDGSVTQTVTTSATIRRGSASGIHDAVLYCYAANEPIDSTLEPYFSASLSGNIESVSTQRDELRRSFSLTRAYREQGVPLYREEYQVSREESAESASIVITINGTVQGLARETSTSSAVRWAAASGAFYNTIYYLIPGRIEEIKPTGTCLADSPTRSNIGWNRSNGQLTYSYTFDNRFLTTNPNIYDEKIDVSYNLPASVVVEIGIPGKSDGPILQDQETVTGYEKTLKIQYTMRPSGVVCGMGAVTSSQRVVELEALNESNLLVNNTYLQHDRGEKPVAPNVFKVADNYAFNRQSYVFTRNVTWKYDS
jgi:hypothetical protein